MADVSRAAYNAGVLAERDAILQKLRAELTRIERDYHRPADAHGLRSAIALIETRKHEPEEQEEQTNE